VRARLREVILNSKAILALVAVLAAAAVPGGCAKPGLSTHATENPKISYEVLFSRNGCEVGRFIDYGRPVYVTVCPGAGLSASQASYVEQCGKSCYRVVDTHQRQIRGNPSTTIADVAGSQD
jgi:hypothetical protein